MKNTTWFLVYLTFLITALASEISQDEDDDVINEIMERSNNDNNNNNIPNTKRNGVPYNYNPFHFINQRTDTPEPKQSKKTVASSIVGDVNKYGLWEYTADNTGMGNEIKNMMNKVENTNLADAQSPHTLEKQANRMNEQINKYAEGNDPGPTVDPMESPVGYTPTEKQAPPGQDLSANHNENFNVVTIPSAMSIEDEHGNHLDTIQDPIRSFNSNNIKPSRPVTKAPEGSFPTHSVLINDPTSSQLKVKPGTPTTSLTMKLLRAIKDSKAFRQVAQKLLSTPAETETEQFQKERKLALFLKTYEQVKENALLNTKLQKPRYRGFDNAPSESDKTIKSDNDIRLLDVIKRLISNADDTNGQRSQLTELLTALKSTEKNAAQMEQNFYDTTGVSESQGKTPSEPFLKHFKEFLNKQKQQRTSSEDQDHPLGTENLASPLLGYLEQETAAVNNIKDAGEDPKSALNKLEQMLTKQKAEQEQNQKEHDKVMLEQFKKLLREGKETKEEEKKIEEPSDSKNKVSNSSESLLQSNETSNSYQDEIYNYIKNSKEFQEFVKTKSSEKSKEASTKDTTDNFSGTGSDSEDSKSIQEQLQDIAEQKEALKMKEMKLHLLKKIKQKGNKKERTENVAEQMTSIISEEEKEKENVDHLLHLASPKKLKHLSPLPALDKNENKLESFHHDEKSSDLKFKSSEEASKAQTEESNDTSGKEFKETVNKEGLKDLKDLSTLIEKGDKLVVHQSSNSQNSDQSAHNLQSEEQFKMVDAHQQNIKTDQNSEIEDLIASNGLIKDKENHSVTSNKEASKDRHEHLVAPESNGNHDENDEEEYDKKIPRKGGKKSKDGTKDETKAKLKNDVKEEKLELPINNPAPKDDNNVAPHPNFHHTHHLHNNLDNGADNTPSKAPSNVIAPIHSPIHSEHHHKPPSLMNLDGKELSQYLPPSGMGKPKLSQESEFHHEYPIEEPPPLVSYHTDTNHHAVIINAESNPAKEGSPNTVSNLLKHKSIPSSANENDDDDVYVTREANIIKPKSHKMVDVEATKKSFGNLPKKPKSYLLKELRKKLQLYAAKRHLMRLVSTKNNPSHQRTYQRFHSKTVNGSRRVLESSKNNKSVLVPSHFTNRIISINHTKTNQSNSNVIVPGSVESKLYGENHPFSVQSHDNIDATDITRSILPNVVRSSSRPSIEEVFNLLGSEDQKNPRNFISRPQLHRSYEFNLKSHRRY